MAHAVRLTDLLRHSAPAGRQTAPGKARPSLLTRLFNAVFESREREAARNVEAYLARTGYRFTDSIEREINDRAFNGGWNPRR
jgi:hypothetical protein